MCNVLVAKQTTVNLSANQYLQLHVDCIENVYASVTCFFTYFVLFMFYFLPNNIYIHLYSLRMIVQT